MRVAESYSTYERILIIIAVLSVTLMQVLDTSIVNVSLPYIQGSLSASQDEVTWTLTSYLMASVIMMPLTGFMVDKVGRKRYLLICVIGFMLTSSLCGMSENLSELVLFRFAQGALGAGLIPLSQGIITSIYPAVQRGKAMAIWSTGVLAGPVLGPVIGGALTSIASWRWSFYINIPIGLVSLILIYRCVEETPHKQRQMDWFSLVLFAVAMSSLAYFLDRGNQQDWFNAHDIQATFGIAILGFWFFFKRSVAQHISPLFQLSLFKDRNFALATIILALTGISMYGTMMIQPILLANLLHYPILTTGLVMAPRGIAGMASMLWVGKIVARFNPKYLILLGVVLSSMGVYFSAGYSLNVDLWHLIYPQLIQGAGMGFIMVPLTTVAFITTPAASRMEAFGLYNLIKTLGFSLGITVTVLVFTHMSQVNWNQLVGHITLYTIPYGYVGQTSLADLHRLALLQNQVQAQSAMLSINNSYLFIFYSLLFMAPLVLLFTLKAQPQNGTVAK